MGSTDLETIHKRLPVQSKRTTLTLPPSCVKSEFKHTHATLSNYAAQTDIIAALACATLSVSSPAGSSHLPGVPSVDGPEGHPPPQGAHPGPPPTSPQGGGIPDKDTGGSPKGPPDVDPKGPGPEMHPPHGPFPQGRHPMGRPSFITDYFAILTPTTPLRITHLCIT